MDEQVLGFGEDCWKCVLDAWVGCVSARTGIPGRPTPLQNKHDMSRFPKTLEEYDGFAQD